MSNDVHQPERAPFAATHRYVVLHHTGVAKEHFDLLIDPDGQSPLVSFRVGHWPPGAIQPATPMAAHRRIYLIYQGEISAGRGQVRRVAEGQAVPLANGWSLYNTDGALIAHVAMQADTASPIWKLRAQAGN
jgi:hypothetical protein